MRDNFHIDFCKEEAASNKTCASIVLVFILLVIAYIFVSQYRIHLYGHINVDVSSRRFIFTMNPLHPLKAICLEK